MGLDRPLYAQYGAFLKGLATGNLGSSLRTNQRVTAVILERLPATFERAFAAMLVATLIAIPLGIIAAVHAGTRVDAGATTLALIGISIQNFWLGPLMAIVFSVELGWLPVSRTRDAGAPRAACRDGDHRNDLRVGPASADC